MPRKQSLDRWSTATVVATVALLGVAVATHGFTHDLLLELGVFLVSLKVVLNGSKVELSQENLDHRLDVIEHTLERIEAQSTKRHLARAPEAPSP